MTWRNFIKEDIKQPKNWIYYCVLTWDCFWKMLSDSQFICTWMEKRQKNISYSNVLLWEGILSCELKQTSHGCIVSWNENVVLMFKFEMTLRHFSAVKWYFTVVIIQSFFQVPYSICNSLTSKNQEDFFCSAFPLL